ncbi:MAG: G5 domain-containing protein, partial [Clostridia bacterium]|nr:G5 domain-containing protein [Clostridia bacterium]
IYENDVVERNDLEDGNLRININRALDVKVIKGEKIIELKEKKGKVKDAIADSKINISETDIINFSEDANLEQNMEIIIQDGVKISLIYEGEEKKYIVPDKTVYEALKYLNIELSQNDIINVDLTSKVKDNPYIKISKIIYRESKKNENIPFKTIKKDSSLLDNSRQQVQTAGKNGIKEVIYNEKLIDGEVVSSEVISSKVIAEPIDEIILVGTRLKPAVSKTKNIQVIKSDSITVENGFKMIEGSATAYTANKGAKTSTGNVPVEGKTVAVNPKLIPYGSTVVVKNLNNKIIFQGIAQDTGSALRKNTATVDIFKTNHGRCIAFGRQKVRVFFK